MKPLIVHRSTPSSEPITTFTPLVPQSKKTHRRGKSEFSASFLEVPVPPSYARTIRRSSMPKQVELSGEHSSEYSGETATHTPESSKISDFNNSSRSIKSTNSNNKGDFDFNIAIHESITLTPVKPKEKIVNLPKISISRPESRMKNDLSLSQPDLTDIMPDTVFVHNRAKIYEGKRRPEEFTFKEMVYLRKVNLKESNSTQHSSYFHGRRRSDDARKLDNMVNSMHFTPQTNFDLKPKVEVVQRKQPKGLQRFFFKGTQGMKFVQFKKVPNQVDESIDVQDNSLVEKLRCHKLHEISDFVNGLVQ